MRLPYWFGLFSFFAATALCAQNTSSTKPVPAGRFSADVKVVLVDVVVTDGKGSPVIGLPRAAFEVFENGKTQTIASFEEHKGVAPKPLELPPMPAGVFTNFPPLATADSVNVLLVDGLNTSMPDQAFARTQMIKYLKTIPPGARLAIFTLTTQLRMVQGFTTDSTALLAAINDADGPKASYHSPLLQSAAEKSASEGYIKHMVANAMGVPPTGLMAETVDPVNSMRQFLAEAGMRVTESRVDITLRALQQLGRCLAGFPGRKNVIWLSGTFPFSFTPDAELPDPAGVLRVFRGEIQQTADLLSSAQVAIYPVATEGLTGDAAYEANADAPGVLTRKGGLTRDQVDRLRKGFSNRASHQTTMEQLARDTGGQAYYNLNGLDEILARVTNNGMRYYTLSYYPTEEKGKGRYRRISVKVAGEKHHLSYRRGYYILDPDAAPAIEQRKSEPLLPIVGFAAPDVSQIVYKLRITPAETQPSPDEPRLGAVSADAGPVTRYDVDFAVAVDDLTLEVGPDGTHYANVEIKLVVYDPEGKPISVAGRRGRISMDKKAYAETRKVGLQVHDRIDVPRRERVHLRSGIYDLNSGKAGTLGVSMRPPAEQPNLQAK